MKLNWKSISIFKWNRFIASNTIFLIKRNVFNIKKNFCIFSISFCFDFFNVEEILEIKFNNFIGFNLQKEAIISNFYSHMCHGFNCIFILYSTLNSPNKWLHYLYLCMYAVCVCMTYFSISFYGLVKNAFKIESKKITFRSGFPLLIFILVIKKISFTIIA